MALWPLVHLDLHASLGVWCLCATRKAVLRHTGSSLEGHRWTQVTVEGILALSHSLGLCFSGALLQSSSNLPWWGGVPTRETAPLPAALQLRHQHRAGLPCGQHPGHYRNMETARGSCTDAQAQHVDLSTGAVTKGTCAALRSLVPRSQGKGPPAG